jgi:tetratricopeptide (TPR) repeat protein
VDGIVQQAMARSAADRWQSAGDLAKALAAAERGSGTPIPGLATWPGVTGEIEAVGATPRNWKHWAGMAVAALAIAGSIFWNTARTSGGGDETAASSLPEPDPMLVLVVPERPANDGEWDWTGILADRVKNLGDLEVVDRRELQSSLLGTPVLATSAADSIAASAGASRIVIVRASEIGEDLRLNLSLYEAGNQAQAVSELDTTVSRFTHDEWAPASVVRLFAGQETGLAGEARLADLNSGLADPEAEIWASKGLSYWTRGQYDSALVSYQRAVAADSTFIDAWRMLRNSANFSVPFQSARKDELLALADSAQQRFSDLGGEDGSEGWLSLEEARRAVAASPDNPEAQLELAQATRTEYWRRGWEPDSILPPILRGIELDPLDEAKWIMLIIYHLCTGDPASLERAYNEAKEAGIADTRVGPLWPALAGIALGPEARRDSVLEGDDAREMAGTITSRLMLLQDDMDLALNVANLLLDDRPRNRLSWSIWALMAGGRWVDGLEIVSELTQGTGLYSWRAPLAASGVLQLPEGEVRAIRDELQADVQTDVFGIYRFHFLGLISAHLGEPTVARSYADSLEALSRDVGPLDLSDVPPGELAPLVMDLALEVRAQASVAEGRLEEALGLLEEQDFGAISEFIDHHFAPSRTLGRFLRAEILRELGRYEEAVGWYATIPRVKMWHQQDVLLHAPVFRGRAQALDALGRQEEALHYYRRFVTRWQDADPHLQPQVEEARQRIRELERELN